MARLSDWMGAMTGLGGGQGRIAPPPPLLDLPVQDRKLMKREKWKINTIIDIV